eukprot:Gb_17754 [translate_table: standard]
MEFRAGAASTDSVPLSVRLFCWLLKSAANFSRRNDGTLNRTLVNWLIKKVPASGIPRDGVYTKDVVIDDTTGVWVRIFIPVNQEDKTESITADEQLPIVFYFHGGAFCALSPADVVYDIFCRRLARKCRVVVISVGYRLAPEHKYPIAYQDCFSALTWLPSHGRHHFPSNVNFSRCFLMGDSAGGNIVHHVGCRAAEEGTDGINVVGHILLHPFFGGQERTPSEVRLVNVPLISVENADWSWMVFLPEGADRDHPAANVFGPNSPDISGLALPPSLVVVGGLDILQDWQMRYFDNLKKLKKEVKLLFYKDGIHAFHVFPQCRESSQLLDDLADFMRTT